MAEYTIPTSVNHPNDRYNPKVEERKMRGNSDWAELVRYQQGLADQMIQREKEKRTLQKLEQRETLDHLMNEKRVKERLEQDMKRQEYHDSLTRQHYYNQYVAHSMDEKAQLQKMFKDEYSREQWEREQENKRKMDNVKQVETKIVNNALDSLQQEKQMKNQQRADFIKSVDQLMQERDMQKRKEMENALKNKEEHRQLQNQYINEVDMKDANYKQYYKMLVDQQDNFRQVHDKKVTDLQRNRDRHIDDFVDNNVVEAKRRAEMEEMKRRLKHENDVLNVAHNHKTKIRDHEIDRLNEKAAYKDKVDELMRKNRENQDFNDHLKNYNTNLKNEYKNILGDQMRANDENRRKLNSDMLDHERNMLLKQFDGLIPGIKSSKAEEYITPNIKTNKSLDYFARKSSGIVNNNFGQSYSVDPTRNGGGQSPVMNQTAPHGNNINQSPVNLRNSMNEIKMNGVATEGEAVPADLRNSGLGNGVPANLRNSGVGVVPGHKNEQGYVHHNPILNPLPYNVQNPYLGKNGNERINSSSPVRQNMLANAAQQSIMTKH